MIMSSDPPQVFNIPDFPFIVRSRWDPKREYPIWKSFGLAPSIRLCILIKKENGE
jgi:hypothetical protein